MRGKHLIALTTSLLLSAPVVASCADLTITIKNVRSAAGMLLVAVYDSDDSFLNLEHARAQMKSKATKGEVVFTVHDLAAGKYAVTAYHDENNNGKLDRNWLHIPTEGYGFSNDARGTAGPPKFTQAAFGLQSDSDKSISLSLQY